MYYDEHPTTFKAMWRQRLRWAKGTLIVCKKRIGGLFKTVFGFGIFQPSLTISELTRKPDPKIREDIPSAFLPPDSSVQPDTYKRP